MRAFISIALFLALRFAVAQPDYTAFPTYPAVVDSFFSRYQVSARPYSTRFEKRTTGWFVSVWYGDSLAQQMPFWSLEDRRFQQLDPIHRATAGEELLSQSAYEGGWVESDYRFCPFYGYPDWFLDVIQHYGGRFDLPDTILYGVARAYAKAASGRISDGEYARTGYQWDLPDGANCMSPAQLREYRDLARMSLTYYDTLAQHDSDFQTHVGEVALKRANEYVWVARQLAIFQNPEAGRDFLADVRYDPFYTAFARNMLRSCQPNTILFTNGDTDTFPLEYVQMAEGFRTDVTVVNMSMFNLPRSIAHYRARTAVPIPFTLADSVFARGLTDVAVLRKAPLASVPVARFLSGVEQQRLNPDITWHAYLDLPSTNFTLPGPAGMDSIRWTLPKDYLLRNGIALFDLLQANAWKRPVYFAVTMGPDSYMGLQDHFALEGSAFRLTPERMVEDSNQFGRVDGDRCLVLFTDSFDVSGTERSSRGRSMLATNYRLHMARVASHLAQCGRAADGERLLDHAMATIPEAVFPLENIGLVVMDAYFECGAAEKADRVALSTMRSMVAKDLTIRNWGHMPEQERADLKERVAERLLDTLDRQKRPTARKEVRRLAKEAKLKI